MVIGLVELSVNFFFRRELLTSELRFLGTSCWEVDADRNINYFKTIIEYIIVNKPCIKSAQSSPKSLVKLTLGTPCIQYNSHLVCCWNNVYRQHQQKKRLVLIRFLFLLFTICNCIFNKYVCKNVFCNLHFT